MTKNCVLKPDLVELNDYGVFVASISIWKDEEAAKFNSLFTLTPVRDLEKDLKTETLERVYVFHGYMDMILALSRIWNAHPEHILHGNKSYLHLLCDQMKEEDANPNFIQYLSNLTTKGLEVIEKSTLKINETNVEIIGLDDSINEISLIWIPELEALVLGENLLKNLNDIVDHPER